LDEPGLKTELQDTPLCLRGSFFTQFIEKFPDLGHAHVLLVLRLVGLECFSDIGAIEVLHATIRRRLLAGSHNTHTMKFEEVGCDWVGLMAQQHQKHVPKQPVPRAAAQGRRKQRAVGGFRAYIHQQCKAGRSFDEMPLFAAEWHAMSLEEKDVLRRLGADATRRRREGRPGLGPSKKAIEREAKQRRCFSEAICFEFSLVWYRVVQCVSLLNSHWPKPYVLTLLGLRSTILMVSVSREGFMLLDELFVVEHAGGHSLANLACVIVNALCAEV
jgi:hypothetical protein